MGGEQDRAESGRRQNEVDGDYTPSDTTVLSAYFGKDTPVFAPYSLDGVRVAIWGRWSLLG